MRVRRIVRQPKQSLDVDHLAIWHVRGRYHLACPIIITEAVHDDQLSSGDLPRDLRTDFEGVRVSVRIGLDRLDLDVFPADLGNHISIHILHANRIDHLRSSGSSNATCSQNGHKHDEDGERFHLGFPSVGVERHRFFATRAGPVAKDYAML
jgi:hypothetical protein